MRILTVTNWYPPHHFGGYELSCYDVMTRLARRGHDVAVLCSDERVAGAEEPDAEHERDVRRRLRLYMGGGELLRPSARACLAIERHNRRALEQELDRFAPDVVSAWHFGALSLGLLTVVRERGIPIVYAVCDDWLVYGPQLDRWAARFAGGTAGRVAGAVVRPLARVPTNLPDLGDGVFCFVSDLTRGRAEQLARWGFPTSTVVYSGIEGKTFAGVERPDRPWGWRLLYTGRFDPRKGVETLVRALPSLPPEATLTMFGRGGVDERARLEALAASLGVGGRITFGQRARDELAAAYAEADCFVFPSEWDEPFGLTPLEAMACGTPVVATGVGGSAEFLRDGENCLGFAAGDHGALAAAVHRLHDDPALRRAVVDGGFATAADLDVDHLADVFESWHDAVAARGARVFPAHRPRPGRAQPRRYVDGAAEPRAELMAAVRGARIRGTMALDLACGGPPVIARRGCATVVVRPRSTDGAHVLAHPAALPFRDDSFATVAATNVLEHLSSPEAAIHELGRVVARGGRVAVAAENVDALDRRARAWTARRRGWYRPFGTEVGRQPPLALTDPAGLRVLVGKIADVDRVTPLDWTGRRRRRALSILTRVPGMRRFAPGFLVEGTTR